MRKKGDLAAFVPSSVEEYHTLYPMDQYFDTETSSAMEDYMIATQMLHSSDRSRSKVFLAHTESYKAIDSSNAQPRLLRRAKIPSTAAGVTESREMLESVIADITRSWSRIRHPNIVKLHRVFLSDQFNTHRSQTLGPGTVFSDTSNPITSPVGYDDLVIGMSSGTTTTTTSSAAVTAAAGAAGATDISDSDGSTPEDVSSLENQGSYLLPR